MEEIVHKLVNESRLLNILHDNLPDSIKLSPLYVQLSAYLQNYLTENVISVNDAIDTYSKYIAAYNKNCRSFIKTGRYPVQNGKTVFSLSRKEYDVVLLFSVLFTTHRFRIMQLATAWSAPVEKGLYIGVGSGLEIALTGGFYKEIFAYDLKINDYLYAKFPNIQLREEFYKGQKQNYFNVVYLIELLEHLEEPYELVKISLDTLVPGGKIFLTTASNIPQFDHYYNFPEDHSVFENNCGALGFSVVFKERIPHHYLSMNLEASNHFYILEKL